ncbi:hypothetical protein L6E12_18105 [Actinokineospora sp. PR83]|uniref:hypothetical protein n=1 Tax=Actinokineospora sp. PR83 TaxID=2884908 RepID=UPI001F1EFF59|nr:hypothetical protein [Actinokineospora sp. PR83]MCG8917699.1 hypothetical protein [Actinokineospora sp. PR83]
MDEGKYVTQLRCAAGAGADAEFLTLDGDHVLWLDLAPISVDVRVYPGTEAHAARFLRKLSEQAGLMADRVQRECSGAIAPLGEADEPACSAREAGHAAHPRPTGSP